MSDKSETWDQKRKLRSAVAPLKNKIQAVYDRVADATVCSPADAELHLELARRAVEEIRETCEDVLKRIGAIQAATK